MCGKLLDLVDMAGLFPYTGVSFFDGTFFVLQGNQRETHEGFFMRQPHSLEATKIYQVQIPKSPAIPKSPGQDSRSKLRSVSLRRKDRRRET